jgi:PEP-CTERM motif-containing protein
MVKGMTGLPMVLVTIFLPTIANATLILLEDFEDSSLTYSSNITDNLSDIANRDYFGRLAPDTDIPPSNIQYTNAQGSGYYGVQDTDGTSSGNVDIIMLDWTGIDVSGFTNLNLSWLIAEDDSSDGAEDWDLTSFFGLSVQTNGVGGYNNIFTVASELGIDGNQSNEKARVDTNADGIGDGTEITAAFQQFSLSLADATSYDIKVAIEYLDAGDEDIAFDNLRLTGDLATSTVPEPATLVLFFIGLIALIGLRCKHA